jgi:hypothetical protein
MKVRQLVASRWTAIRQVAGGHGIDRIRWWPATYGAESSADFLVDGELGSLRELRVDLERALGCKVAIYLADQVPPDLLAGDADEEASGEPGRHAGSSSGSSAAGSTPRDKDGT